MSKYKWITMGVTLMAIAALSAMFAVTTFGSVHEIRKELTLGDPTIEISKTDTTPYQFQIYFGRGTGEIITNGVFILDTVPAEFEVLDLLTDLGQARSFQTGKSGKSATRIEWDLHDNDIDVPPRGATLIVNIQTRPSPGRKGIFKPTSCGPLPINDGATVFQLDPATGELVQIGGPSNPLIVTAVAGAEACETPD